MKAMSKRQMAAKAWIRHSRFPRHHFRRPSHTGRLKGRACPSHRTVYRRYHVHCKHFKYHAVKNMSLNIGVDVGGTTSTICVGDDEGRIVNISPQFPTRNADGPDATIQDIVNAIVAALTKLDSDLGDVRRVTIATPGPATRDGVLSSTPNLRRDIWENCPIRELLQLQLQNTATAAGLKNTNDLTAGYVGDGQAAALGEFAARRGDVSFASDVDVSLGIDPGQTQTDLDSLFMVAVGTGLGGGEVRGGKVIQGAEGRAGHAGHIMLPADAFRYDHDRTLQVGNATSTVESAVSLTALTHQVGYRLQLPQWKDHALNQVPGTDKDRAKLLRELAANGDALALELFEDQAKALGVALLCIQYIGDYDVLVIGGGVCDLSTQVRSQYLTTAKQSFYDRALDGFRSFDRIEFSRCGDHASVIGAYFHALGN